MARDDEEDAGNTRVGATPAYVYIARAWMSAREERDGPNPVLSGLSDAEQERGKRNEVSRFSSEAWYSLV
jgi:hypothetical protein